MRKSQKLTNCDFFVAKKLGIAKFSPSGIIKLISINCDRK